MSDEQPVSMAKKRKKMRVFLSNIESNVLQFDSSGRSDEWKSLRILVIEGIFFALSDKLPSSVTEGATKKSKNNEFPFRRIPKRYTDEMKMIQDLHSILAWIFDIMYFIETRGMSDNKSLWRKTMRRIRLVQEQIEAQLAEGSADISKLAIEEEIF